jgi:D-arabinose 1-dehydrogenase-like Zn-dependent alcohol dehydrogenase
MTMCRCEVMLRIAHQMSRRFSTTMRAMKIEQIGKPLTFRRDVPVKEPQRGEVRVKIENCAVCHRDVLDRNGAFKFLTPGVTTGHEVAGVIEKVGAGVNLLTPGDRVVTLHWAPCGECTPCSTGHATVCEGRISSFLGITADGGYAESVVVGESACVPFPAEFSFAEASTVMCTYGTVYHSLFVRGRLAEGERLLVTGASGGVGSAAVQMASKRGEVIAATTRADKVDYLRALGASHVIVGQPDALSRNALLKEKPVDVVLETGERCCERCVGARR